MKAKNAQEVRSEHKEDWGLWLIALFIIVAAIVYFARMHPAQAFIFTDGGANKYCWTHAAIQSIYTDQDQLEPGVILLDGCWHEYFPVDVFSWSACCLMHGSIVPVEFDDDNTSTGTRIVWYCRDEYLSSGPTNGQLILFDTDVYVGFLPDPTCYEP